MKYVYLVLYALLSIVTLFGLLPEADAGQRCYQQNGSVQCYNDDGSSQRCWTNGNRVTCY